MVLILPQAYCIIKGKSQILSFCRGFDFYGMTSAHEMKYVCVHGYYICVLGNETSCLKMLSTDVVVR